jgi:virginiamycin B lyase
MRRVQYISASTQSAYVSVAPAGGGSSTFVTINCTTVCSGQISAPIGSDTFGVQLYDQANAAGNILSRGTLTQTIVAGTANAVNVTFNGVVASLAVSLMPPTVTVGTAATVGVNVSALDPDGNTIIGPGVYVNVSGSPLTVTLTDSDGTGATALSQTSLTQPTSGITLSYSGASIVNPVITAGATLITPATATLNIVGGPPTTTYCQGLTGGAGPYGITTGPDGALWFTEFFDNEIGRMTATGCNVTQYPAGPVENQSAYGITSGPDGALWFTEFTDSAIGRMTTAGVVTTYPLPTTGAGPETITAGPDGALWFVETYGDKIGRITTGGTITEYPVPTSGAEPSGIVTGPDGNLWFTEMHKVGRITPGGTITEYAAGIATGVAGYGITAGPDGALWFTQYSAFYGSAIGRITTTGTITEYTAGLTYGGLPANIAAGPDGALWFTEDYGGKIGRITTAGTITEYVVANGSTLSHPWDITEGPDGAMWFTDFGLSEIDRITVP